MRWRKLILDLDGTIETLRVHTAKTFHLEDGKIRVEAKLAGDPIMVMLSFADEAKKDSIIKALSAEGFIQEEIVIEPDW